MSHKNVYYINIKPYIYDLKFDQMIYRFLNSEISNKYNIYLKNECKEFLLSYMNNFQYLYVRKNRDEFFNDKSLSKDILNHLELFFAKTLTNETRKRINKKDKNKSKTRKKG